MTVYVDELINYGQAPKAGAERYFGNGEASCHMMADSLDELHEFAARLGLKRAWCQPGLTLFKCHYDLTPNKRAQAVRMGAVQVTTLEIADKLGGERVTI